MTRQTPEFDQRIADWLEADPMTAPPDVLTMVAAALPSIPQARRGLLAPWRFQLMNGTMRIASAAIVAVVAVGGALYLIGPGFGPGGRATPSPAPTVVPTQGPTPSPAPTVAPTPTLPAAAFTSPVYGYTVTRPAGWYVTPATLPWPYGAQPNPDEFVGPPSEAGDPINSVYISAQPVPDGMTSAAWQLDYAELVADSGRDCKGPVDAWTDAVVGSLAVRRLELVCFEMPWTDVAFVIDGTGYAMAGNGEVIADFLSEFQPGT